MLIAVLGRQPELSLAELESRFGADKIKPFSDKTALIDADNANINDFGGVLKLAQVELQFKATSYHQISKQIIDFYSKTLPLTEGKITVGFSWYDSEVSASQVQKIGLRLKSKLKKQVSFRLIPNKNAILSTATAHHNRLGNSTNKIEIIITQNGDKISVGRSIGAQNISAYAARDQKRPKRDARVGMLPPKLAQVIINLARGDRQDKLIILDPFCGTGVLLQEAHLMGLNIVGSDKEPRMINFSKANLNWLDNQLKPNLEVGDATTHRWSIPIDAVACETYLGKPFAKQPSQADLNEQKQIVESIVSGFLKNIHDQIKPGARLALAIPAWKRLNGQFKTLDLVQPEILDKLGYQLIDFKHVDIEKLIYHRPDQAVGRRLLVIKRK